MRSAEPGQRAGAFISPLMGRLRVATLLLCLAPGGGCKHGPLEPPEADAGFAADAAAPTDGGLSTDAGLGPKPGAWRDGVYYEVFVRSFADSDGDGIGDLRGLIAKLDTLNDGDPSTDRDLGVTGLWLMPIHPSPSYHGYDVTDYQAVRPEYGSQADLEALVAAAHQRGMAVIIDFVLNHSSTAHPWFQASSASPSSPERGYYRWRADDPGWTQPWGAGHVWHPLMGSYYYGIFWSGMPDLNLGNPAVEQKMVEAMRHWLGAGIDGFRVDAARHLFESADGQLSDQAESHALIRRMRSALEASFPQVLLVAEAWTDLATVSTYYGQGDEFNLAFGFDTASALKTAAKDGLRASFNQVLAQAEQTYSDRGFEAPFLSNHDMPRVQRELAGDTGAMRVAAAALFSLPGTPFLYYGEEIGMLGGPATKDEDKRTPMRWTAEEPNHGFTVAGRAPWYAGTEAAGVDVESQRGAPGSLWTLYRDLIRTRRGSPALSHGTASRPAVTGGGRGGAALLRTAGDERVLFLVNFAAQASGPIDVAAGGVPTVLFAEGLSGTPSSSAGQVHLEGLAARGFAFVKLQ